MTAEELKDIALCGETTTIQFKQEFTGQKEIAKEMIAFANTRGGKIIFGIKDKTGELLGLSYDDIQSISRELGNTANEQVRPTIYIDTEVVRADGKHFLVCTVEQGKNKPYKTLTGEIWVKQGADKRRITENVEILELFQDSGTYKPELQALKGSSVSNLEMTVINEYFKRNFGKEKEAFGMPLENLLQSQKILTDNNELTVAGAMFFARDPQFFMPTFVIKAVAFYGNDIAGSEYRDSRDISGTIPWMFREAMSFAKSNLHHRQNGQNFNKTGILEIPEVVLEELLQNSLVHLDLLEPAAIRLLIFDNRIEIINAGCLYGGLEVKDILLGVTKQRNPTIASLSSRTMIYRGLGSGILRATRENVKVEFVNNESTNEFKTIVWRIVDNNNTDLSGQWTDKLPTSEDLSGQWSDKLPDKVAINTDKVAINTDKGCDNAKNIAIKGKRQDILDYLSQHQSATSKDLSQLLAISTSRVKIYLNELEEAGLITPHGANKNRTYSIRTS